jgi:hypothetical protein
MSAKAITTRLRRTAQLRDLCLRLAKARPPNASARDDAKSRGDRQVSESGQEYHPRRT